MKTVQTNRMAQAQLNREKTAMKQFLKTNTAGDCAKWLSAMSPHSQIKKIELITKQHSKISFEADGERIRANLRKKEM